MINTDEITYTITILVGLIDQEVETTIYTGKEDLEEMSMKMGQDDFIRIRATHPSTDKVAGIQLIASSLENGIQAIKRLFGTLED